MSRSDRRRLRPWSSILATGAVVLGSVAGGGLASAAHAADATDPTSSGGSCATSLISASFDDGTLGSDLEQDGNPSSLTYEQVAGDTGEALRVNGRTQSYDGIQTTAGALSGLAAGDVVTVTAKVRLATTTTATTSARIVANDGTYAWVGNQSGISDSAWTTIGGTYTVGSSVDLSSLSFYVGTDSLTDTTSTYDYDVDDFTLTVTDPGSTTLICSDFESGDTDGWTARADGNGQGTVSIVDGGYASDHALEVSGRTDQGQGVGHDVTGLLQPGQTYEFSGWVRFPAGAPTDDVWLSLANTVSGSTSYTTLGQFTGMSNTGWVHVDQKFTMPSPSDSALLYLETKYFSDGSAGNTSDLLFDDLQVTEPPVPTIQDITPIKSTLPFPVGAAVSDPELVGAAGQLLAKHFNQVTPENAMKPESWYDADGTFVSDNPDVDQLMTFAQQNGMRVYGHNLAWYQQTPDWFFDVSPTDSTPLTNSPADQAILRDRLDTHIKDVAQYLATKFGAFGSASDPLVSFDVVNEAVSDNAGDPDDLRQSRWYQVLGPEYIEDAFDDANKYFDEPASQGGFAADGSNRPIALFYNDYNTEQAGKRSRVLELVNKLIADNVPIDGIGHQFHVTMSTPVSDLQDAIEAFQGITTAASAGGHELYQAVTELDVPTGTPVTEANQIDQGYYYKDVFDMLRAEYAKDPDIFSATVWGLTDGQSWRASSGAPLLFDDDYQAKPAYYGVTDQQLPPKELSAIVFQQSADDVDATASTAAAATGNVEWHQLPLHQIGDNAGFQLRWASDHLTAYVSSADATDDPTDAATLQWNDGGATSTATVNRDGTVTGGVTAKVTSTASGWQAVVDLPTDTLTTASTPQIDVAVTDGSTTSDWNTPGSLGTLQLVEPLSYTTIPEASTAPTIDGTKDAVWNEASTVTTDKLISGDTNGAKATVYQLWKDNYLYVLADVTDPTIDVSSPNAYEQDSVEIFTDPGNAKNGSYRPDDAQMRINVDNAVSFGAGDTEEAQAARLTSATSRTATGYIVEARIDLKDGNTGIGKFEGLDYEVNDGTNGARTANYGWAEQTGTAYETTSRWGVAQLVAASSTPTGPGPAQLKVTGPGIGSTAHLVGGTAVHGLQYAATGGTGAVGWTASGLPAGLTLTKAGALSGTPIQAGTFHATVSAQDAAGHTVSAKATLVVTPGVPVVDSITAPRGKVHQRYVATVRISGASLTWKHGKLPAGLHLTSSSYGTVVTLSGKPAHRGRTKVVLRGIDAAGHRITVTMRIVVR